ncbi:MAG TPA: HAD family hydrolase [Clostridia bacterium]|nr:HAD family hydrolase [Clostridia bacterium]
MEKGFDAVFYDLGGTLRLVERDAEFEARARRRIAELCGEPGDADAFCKFLDYRYEGYRKWCFETMREAPEWELWSKWLAPEYPRELIVKNAVELTIEFRNKDGRRVVAKNGAQSIRDLYANGYKLGIISNLVTSKEIPDWLEHDDLAGYFGAVLLSCVEGIRKPDPRISEKACSLLGVEPARCAYIGDNLKRDVEGTRMAGFGMFILYTTPEKLAGEKITDANRPDAVIFDFAELKELFPKAPEVAWEKVRKA